MQYWSWDLEIAPQTAKANRLTLVDGYMNFRNQNNVTKQFYDGGILHYSTHNFYDANYVALIATQPLESIDEQRVQFFEEEIKNGKRPFAIVLYKYCEIITREQDSTNHECLNSAYFVLDGHHKLLAYKRQNIYPPILSISSFPEKKAELVFDLEKLRAALVDWQYEHLVETMTIMQ